MQSVEGHPRSNERGKKYQDPVPTVDIVLRRSKDSEQTILIERRGRPPFEGKYSLPGGHVDYGETVEHAVVRELHEECGAEAFLVGILGVYSDPNRDPRGQRISTVFIGDYAGGEIKADDDAKSVEWIELHKLLGMRETEIAFDHFKILNDYKKWLGMSKKAESTFWSTKNMERKR
jgi:ADP-ribose pyrophosphatase YjhB (NUDIX family)